MTGKIIICKKLFLFPEEIRVEDEEAIFNKFVELLKLCFTDYTVEFGDTCHNAQPNKEITYKDKLVTVKDMLWELYPIVFYTDFKEAAALVASKIRYDNSKQLQLDKPATAAIHTQIQLV